MTTYSTTWTGETTGSFSTNFTSRYAATTDWTVENPADTEEDDRVFQTAGTGSGIQLVSWDNIDGDANRANCELVGRFRLDGDDDNNWHLCARGSGASTTETFYYLGISSGGSVYIGRYNGGTFTSIDATNSNSDSGYVPWYYYTSGEELVAYTFNPPNRWLYARFRVNGTGATVTLQAKVWADGQNEPSEWLLDTTDTSGSRITAAGWVGLGRQTHDGTIVCEYDYLGVGTNGDTAPITVDSANNIRITQEGAQVLASEASPVVRLTQEGAQALVNEAAPDVRISQSVMQAIVIRSSATGTSKSTAVIITGL